MRSPVLSVTTLVATIALLTGLGGANLRAQDPDGAAPHPHDACSLREANAAFDHYIDQVRAGELPDPNLRRPDVAPRTDYAGAPGVVTTDDLFLFEDSAQVLIGPWTQSDLSVLMVDGANALLAAHGDNFDFVGYFLAYEPSSQFGAAFYGGVSNDVSGIGDLAGVFGVDDDIFDKHDELGLAGEAIQGFIMMWWIDVGYWAPGAGPEADFTRLALGQEFEHRFAMFLPPLLDGRVLQGNNANCGRTSHWNWQVDGQGSSMELSEWVGSSPAVPAGTFVTFNTDIPGSVFGYTDLYLMGYVTPAEMDAGNSELRFMDTSDCSSNYSGNISSFDSSDIIASAGPRIPSSATAQKDFRTGWVVFHLPGQLPTNQQLTDIAGILNQHTLDWSTSTLGLGTIDNTLPGPNAFTDVGNALPGTNGTPSLVGIGSREAGTEATLILANALPGGSTALVLGFSELGAPFKGGVMVPNPDAIIQPLPIDGSGGLTLSFTWPAGLPSGLPTWWQHWFQDAGGVFGWAASNAVRGDTP